MEEKLSGKNTVHWLRELLSSNGPYETRLTALPPRTRRDQNSSTGRIRSQTAPAKPVTELFLGATPRPDSSNPGVSKPENGDERTAAMTKTFAKTINDLELLLNEALYIARQAADKEDSNYAPGLLGSAAAILKGGRKRFENSIVRRRANAHGYGQKLSDNISSIGSIHESFGSYTGSSGSEDSLEGQGGELYPQSPPELRIKAPTVGIVVTTQVAQTIHQAGWPPTGRIPTPYPPGSMAASPLESTELKSRGELPNAEMNSDSMRQMKLAVSNSKLSVISPEPTTALVPIEVQGENASPISELLSGGVRDINPFLDDGRLTKAQIRSTISSEAVSPMKRSRATTGRRYDRQHHALLRIALLSRKIQSHLLD